MAFANVAFASYFDEEPEITHKDYHRGPPEHTHLVTMRKDELMDIINCVSDGKNKILGYLKMIFILYNISTCTCLLLMCVFSKCNIFVTDVDENIYI